MGKMNPGMRMMVVDRVRKAEGGNRSEYGGGSNRRMIGYDRDRNGQANTFGYAEMEGGSTNYGNGYGGGGTSGYAENRRYYGGPGMENAAESRRGRDSRGRYAEGGSYNEGYRSEYNEGRYGYGRNEAEARRRRDGRGRYMMEGMADEEEEEMRGQRWFPPERYMPPQNNMMRPGNTYGDIYAHGTVWAPGAMHKQMEHGGHEQYGEMDEHTARHWVRKMRNADGTPSPHWQPEQVEQLRMQHCPECSMWEFWACMNMMYADYCGVAKKMGIDKPEFYAGMAKAFLEDEDAKDGKLMRYMKAIAE